MTMFVGKKKGQNMGNIGFDNDSEHKSVTSNLTSKNASNVTLQDSDQDQQSQSEYSGESSSESTSHTTKLPTMSANAVSIDSLDEDANVAEFDKLMQERQAKKKKRVIRRIIIAVIVVALIVGFMVYRALQPSKDAEAVAIPTSKVETGHFLDQVSSTGSIEPISSTMVTAQIDGTIGEVKVQEGAQVNAGDVLFTINNDKLDQDVNQADLAVRAAESGVNTAQTQVNQMNASLAAARQQGGSEEDVAASDVSDQLANAR